MAIDVLRSPLLEGTAHGFLGRTGGVSVGTLEGLNVGLGSSDDRLVVVENRRLAIAAIAPDAALVTVHQIHSASVVHARAPWPDGERPPADAIVTDQRGLLLGILTADCAPILLADGEAGVIGAAHAGWRGALGGIAEEVIAAMESLGANRSTIHAVVGPCISQASYEVDPAFRERFLADDPGIVRFFSAASGAKPHFNLPAFVLDRLERAGVKAEAVARDTYAEPAAFYSYRRSVHRGEADYGRQLSAIALP